MTQRVVLACDGDVGVHHCHQAIPVGAVRDHGEARVVAQSFGWSVRCLPGGAFHDLCPACTGRERRAGR